MWATKDGVQLAGMFLNNTVGAMAIAIKSASAAANPATGGFP